MTSPDYLLEELNHQQARAVKHFEGPLLVFSGAGSGKTRVITRRIGYLISHYDVSPDRILGLTFTNKAADEMSKRLSELVSLPVTADGPWLGTFHSLGAQFLREHIELLERGYDRFFTIYDQGDQKRAVRETMKEIDLSTEEFNPRMVASLVNKAKNDLIGPDAFRGEKAGELEDYILKIVSRIYRKYQGNLSDWNGLDFGDLIRLSVELLQSDKPRVEAWRDRFEFVLVDEYQDTNHAQYVMANLLTAPQNNLCVVGDDDQAIFGWRGADVGNILEFEEDYPEANVINLSKNYRSRRPILRAANSVISNNRLRKSKDMEPIRDEGKSITVYHAQDERDEAYFLSDQVKQLKQEGTLLGEIAILYRVNPLSRKIEEKLVQESIPYEIVRGTRFYERKEVKDILAYLRVICNPYDEVSLLRILNYPKRGIGKKTKDEVRHYVDAAGFTLWDVVSDPDRCTALSLRQINRLSDFAATIISFRQRKDELAEPAEFVGNLVSEIGYYDQLKKDYGVQSAEDRKNNVRELIGQLQESKTSGGTLEDFLESVALESDVDDFDNQSDKVSLLTLHSAKGLEFSYVFLVAFEDGLLPHRRSLEEDRLEEERRLCYVGLTRAKEQVFLSYTKNRYLYGQRFQNLPSRFLNEIPDEELSSCSRPGGSDGSKKNTAFKAVGSENKGNWRDFLA